MIKKLGLLTCAATFLAFASLAMAQSSSSGGGASQGAQAAEQQSAAPPFAMPSQERMRYYEQYNEDYNYLATHPYNRPVPSVGN